MGKLKADPNNIHPSDDVVRHVRNCSSRHGVKPILIVLHDTEGANIPKSIRDLQGLGDWFDNPAAEASAHVGTDSDGNSARFVADSLKAWSCVFYNAPSLNIEQVGFATQKTWPDAQLQETARWIARWAHAYDIPIRHGHVSLDGRIIQSGVIRHSELGHLGGDHHDPDNDPTTARDGVYPFAGVLRIARGYLHLLEKA
jgi:hypothetical protein